jgi:L-fuculose-phosphate aldolase
MLMDRNEARAAVAQMGRTLIQKHLVAGSWGNISCRTDVGCIAITPSGRGYEGLEAEDIVILDAAGAVVDGRHIPSSESRLHTAIYAACPQAQAIIHTHSVYASALAAMHQDVPAIIEDIVQIIGGRVRCATYAMCGTQQLADNAVAALDGRKAALLANHGAVCWGTSLADALMVAEILEKAAQIAVICQSTGGRMHELDAAEACAMHTFYEQHYAKRQRGEE